MLLDKHVCIDNLISRIVFFFLVSCNVPSELKRVVIKGFGTNLANVNYSGGGTGPTDPAIAGLQTTMYG